MSNTPPSAALLADARNVLAYSSDPQALSAARLVVARAETAAAPLRLAEVLPWVRKAFALTTTDVGFTDEPSLVVAARCRACKAAVAPTADALAEHECAT